MTDRLAIPVEHLALILRLEPETGQIYWLRREPSLFKAARDAAAWNTRYAGRRAFTYLGALGYPSGRILGRQMEAHRIIFALHHGRWPSGEVDHINGDRADNRPVNLRDVSHQENTRNARKPYNNTSGVVGVRWDKKTRKWHAFIGVSKRTINLGYYSDKNDAISVRASAERQYGFHVNHGRSA